MGPHSTLDYDDEAATMTTHMDRGHTTPPALRSLVDAPVIRAETLTAAQTDGGSCCWCSAWADPRFPVPILRGSANLHACSMCAGVYGVPAASA